MEVELPYRDHQDNLLLTRTNDIWAYYRISPTNVSRHHPEKRQEVNQDIAQLLKKIAPYGEYHSWGLPENLDMESKVKELEPQFASGEEDLANYYLGNSITYLQKDNGLIYQRGYLIGVKLSTSSEAASLKEAGKTALKQLATGVMGVIGYELADPQTYFEAARQIEEDLFTTMTLHGGQRLTHAEMLYLTRIPFIRNQVHRVEDEAIYQSVKETGQALVDSGDFKTADGRTVTGVIKLCSETGTSFIKILPLYDLPDYGLGLDIHRFAEEQRFGVECHTEGVTASEKMVGLKLHVTEGKLDEEAQNALRHQDEVSKKNLQHRFLAKNLRDEMEDNEPLFNHLDCLVVYGHSPEQTLARANGLRKLLDGKIGISPATKDQMRLFYQLLPGNSLQEKNWLSRSNAEALGEYAFATAEYIGMRSGFYIGRIDTVGETLKGQTVEDLVNYSSRYVFLNPLAIAEGIAGALYDTPHIAITGKSGKGKTFLAGLIFLFSSFFSVQSLFVDPKSEKRQAFEAVIKDPYYQKTYPWFCDYLSRMHYVTLDADSPANFGVLDPFVFQTKKEEMLTTIDDMLKELLPNLTGHEEAKVSNAIHDAFQAVYRQHEAGEQVGSLHVVEVLTHSEDELVKEYGTYLYHQILSTNMRLAFSYGENSGLDFSKRVSILEIKDLKLPDKKTQTYTKEDRRSLALMIALSRFCVKFGSRDRKKNTSIFFTEAWTLSNSQKGAALIEEMGRVGRSYKNQMILDTQFIKDVLNEDGTGNFGLLFCFDEETDRENILRLLGLPVDETTLKEMQHMIKGQCWFRDLVGDVAKLNVHCQFEEIAACLKTVEKTAFSKAEELTINSQ